ncbi:2,4-dihydroxyhept-2-ene-1,7-dioic acid aldolase [Mycena venus]|uniref:2,4-dihydroxyhept-2-ene-1,7-dioic acid aldolase n=1 Tax=Mycena venus TaxID=2733690 RepID=A0A8H6XPM4_9AGAR|nr:2,4-dihydroxyhept-2-ene-1,7-dioic acid aldolase [Mycena venus]
MGNPRSNGYSNGASLPPPRSDFWKAPTPQQSSNFRGLGKSGQVLYGVMLSMPSVPVAKVIAAVGADFCWIDQEHTPCSPDLLMQLIQTVIHESGGQTIPVVRVPSKTSFEYMVWCLNAGAGGIVVPHVETEAEVEAIVATCRYPPLGHRSVQPFHFIPGVTDTVPEGESLFSIGNKNVAIIPQIESLAGLNNVEAIMRNPGVDMVMVGARDLRTEMGLFGLTGSEPEYIKANERIIAAAKANKVPLMAFTPRPDMFKQRIHEGFTVLMVSADFLTLALGTIGDLKRAKGIAEEHAHSCDETY